MTTTAAPSVGTVPLPPGAASPNALRDLVTLYTCTDADYGIWSRDFNMHFGLCDAGMNPFDREAMLDRMNAYVACKLQDATQIVDLGCGTGATARALVRARPDTRVSGVTIVPAQIARGNALNAASGLSDSIQLTLADYSNTGLQTSAYDAAYAIESACHAPGPDKRPLLVEARRLLKPSGKLVIADCFLRRRGPLPWTIRPAYRAWCRSWAVPELACLDDMCAALRETGYADIEVEDVSWKVAPSVAHVPYVATRFLIAELWKSRGRITPWRRRHIVASWLSVLLGLCRGSFAYCLITARATARSAS